MISKFTTVLGGAGINIAEMTNKSRGEVAYSVFDVDSRVSDETIKALQDIEDVFRVRVIQ